ncbi:unnamed protein product [Cylindrotheca closterium]|uniref:Phytanoyl-CoA dioxygenase n=1 Tax=Cylindrotheca closterium TaxID=2856 RepID=A0AAD2G2S1_9STRA|nr:unnamed protein product [Cylindrotheca closterium]
MVDDGYDMFGSDDEKDDDVVEDEGGADGDDMREKEAMALYLSTFFLKRNPQVKPKDRIVGVFNPGEGSVSALEQRGFSLVSLSGILPLHLDAAVLLGQSRPDGSILNNLLPGGILVSEESNCPAIVNDKEYLTPTAIEQSKYVSRIKRSVKAHTSTCPWLPSSFSHNIEREHLEQGTVALSASEVGLSQMAESSKRKAVESMQEHGYVVIRNLLRPEECQKWGTAVLESVHMAADKLLKKENVNILEPQNSENEPQSYREMSMREDLRLDLRDGPALAKLRNDTGDTGQPVVVSGKTETENFHRFLRGHSCLLDVIRRTMNPKKGELYKGNLGRYNFEGSGPDGSFQDIRVSQVGGIVSFPGAADQSIHADCSHLFEIFDCHPAHYINIFAPGVPFHEKAGGTAFFHGSHNLKFTAKHCGSTDDYSNVFPYLVRPSLSLGDVVLFDCRILHFGLSNTSDSVERALLYCNTTQAWFTDPKNWEDQRPIFEES